MNAIALDFGLAHIFKYFNITIYSMPNSLFISLKPWPFPLFFLALRTISWNIGRLGGDRVCRESEKLFRFCFLALAAEAKKKNRDKSLATLALFICPDFRKENRTRN